MTGPMSSAKIPFPKTLKEREPDLPKYKDYVRIVDENDCHYGRIAWVYDIVEPAETPVTVHLQMSPFDDDMPSLHRPIDAGAVVVLNELEVIAEAAR